MFWRWFLYNYTEKVKEIFWFLFISFYESKIQLFLKTIWLTNSIADPLKRVNTLRRMESLLQFILFLIQKASRQGHIGKIEFFIKFLLPFRDCFCQNPKLRSREFTRAQRLIAELPPQSPLSSEIFLPISMFSPCLWTQSIQMFLTFRAICWSTLFVTPLIHFNWIFLPLKSIGLD